MQSLPSEIHSLPAVIPLEIKFGMIIASALALIITSYINRRSYLNAKVIELENTVASLKETIVTIRRLSAELENKLLVVEERADFMFTNTTHLQKALYKKLVLEEKYRDNTKEPFLTKNRQQATQEYAMAQMTVARRFAEV